MFPRKVVPHFRHLAAPVVVATALLLLSMVGLSPVTARTCPLARLLVGQLVSA